MCSNLFNSIFFNHPKINIKYSLWLPLARNIMDIDTNKHIALFTLLVGCVFLWLIRSGLATCL
jgi:hypothetical protein